MQDFCTKTAEILVFVGWVLTIFKIAIPLFIIGYGMFDFGKAVVASKDDEIKKSVKSLIWRAIAGVAIFFIPSLVLWIFGIVKGYNQGVLSDYKTCEDAILRPWNVNVPESDD